MLKLSVRGCRGSPPRQRRDALKVFPEPRLRRARARCLRTYVISNFRASELQSMLDCQSYQSAGTQPLLSPFVQSRQGAFSRCCVSPPLETGEWYCPHCAASRNGTNPAERRGRANAGAAAGPSQPDEVAAAARAGQGHRLVRVPAPPKRIDDEQEGVLTKRSKR